MGLNTLTDDILSLVLIMSWMYGLPVNITAVRCEGQAPDGTARPGAMLESMVRFDASQSGCGDDGYCNPGADISWYENGVFKETTLGSGFNGSLSGYVVSHSTIAPASGTVTIEARSLNTVSFVVKVSATDTNAGNVVVTDIACKNQEDWVGAGLPACECNGNTLTMYFTTTPTDRGNGMAYYNVISNGNTVVSNGVDSTYDTSHRGSVTIPCQPANSVITIRGANDSGEYIQTGSGSNLAGTGVDSPYYNAPTPYTPPSPDTPSVINQTPFDYMGDIVGKISTAVNENKLLAIGGLALLGGIMLFGGKRRK